MPKRKPKFPKHSSRSLLGASGVTLSEAWNPTPNYPAHFSPVHRQTLYTVNVSSNMLRFIERMASDPTFRNKVDRLF